MNAHKSPIGKPACLWAAWLLALPAAGSASTVAVASAQDLPAVHAAGETFAMGSATGPAKLQFAFSSDANKSTGRRQDQEQDADYVGDNATDAAGRRTSGDDVNPDYPSPPTTTDDVNPVPPPPGKKKDDDKDWVVPAIAIGAIAIAVIHNAMKKKPAPDPGSDPVDPGTPDPVADLLRNGPEFSGLYNASAFMMSGLAKGNWPIVVEFELPEPGHVELMIRTRTSETYRYRLDGGAVGRRHIVLPLPPDLADNLEPALIAVTATTAPGSGDTLPGFRLLGLGCGPRAIGSVAIDKVTLSTPEIISSAGQTAAYSFFAHSSFENAVVDFMKVKDSVDGETYDWVNNHRLAGGVEANHWVGEQERLVWDGRSRDQQTSLGVHKVQVRVWHSEGDWVSAWSDSSVFVRE